MKSSKGLSLFLGVSGNKWKIKIISNLLLKLDSPKKDKYNVYESHNI